MKNRGTVFLLALTILFIGMTIGFSVGRNLKHEPVVLTSLQPSDGSGPAATAESAPAPDSAETDCESETVPDTTSATAEKVNINSADTEEMSQLPGIGPVLARRIVEYRTAHGNFHSVDELLHVNGIGVKRLEAIKDHATVGG